MKKYQVTYFLSCLFVIGCIGFAVMNSLFGVAVKIAISAAVVLLFVAQNIFLFTHKEIWFKLFFTVISLCLLFLGVAFLLDYVDFFSKVKDVESLREYIDSFGSYAIVVFFIIQFLQVIISFVPATVTIGAGALLFGAVESGIISFFATVLGSAIAFIVGKKFGKKAIVWIIGKESLDKGLSLIKGKDTVAISLMFLFPFFPDDILCFVAGLTTMPLGYFLVIIAVTRIITIVTTSATLSAVQLLIDYSIPLTVVVLLVVVAIISIVFYYGMKNAARIQEWMEKKLFIRRKKKSE